MFQRAKRVFLGAALAAGFGFAALPARAASVNVTFQNETNATYDLYDVTNPGSPGTGPIVITYSGYGSNLPPAPVDTTISLTDGDTYRIATGYNHASTTVGHSFTLSGTVSSTDDNAFFNASGTTVTLTGKALTLTTTSATGNGDNPLLFMQSGLGGVLYVDGGGTSVYTGINYLAPADGYYTGDYAYLTKYGGGFDDSGMEPVSDFQLGLNSMTVTPTAVDGGNFITLNPDNAPTFTPTAAPADHVAGDLVFGNAIDGHGTIHFDFAVPEPASLSLIGIGGLMMLRRGKRNSR